MLLNVAIKQNQICSEPLEACDVLHAHSHEHCWLHAAVSQYGASQFSNTGIPVPGLGSMTTDATAAQQAITNMDYRGARTNMEAGIAGDHLSQC